LIQVDLVITWNRIIRKFSPCFLKSSVCFPLHSLESSAISLSPEIFAVPFLIIEFSPFVPFLCSLCFQMVIIQLCFEFQPNTDPTYLSSETKTSYIEMEVVKACQQPILWFDSSSVKKKEVHKDKLWVTSLANIQIIMFIKKQHIQGCKIFDPLGLIASPDPEIPVIQTSSIWYPYLMVKTCCYANNLYVVTRHSRSNSWIYTDNSVMDFF